MNRFLKTLLCLCITLFTLYVGTWIVRYGLLLILSLVILIIASLLYVHLEGMSSREALWAMSRDQRQRHHARNLELNMFSVIPQPQSHPVKGYFPWHEGVWRTFSKQTGDRLTQAMKRQDVFLKEIDNYVVRSGFPTAEEVERSENTIVLSVRGLWAGLAARINPVLNAFLNRYVKCWNRSLVFTTVRLSSYGLPFPTLSIDFPTTDASTLNFGQKDDCIVMSHIYDKVRQMYPKAKIILSSVCLGGLRILNWLSRNPNPDNVIAVVLESPLPSVRHLIDGFLGSYSCEELYRFFCLLVPNFRPELEEQYSFMRPMQLRGETSDSDQISRIPMFVGVIDTDPFFNNSHLPLLTKRFPNVSFFSTHDDTEDKGKDTVPHGQLYRVPEYREAVQQFITVIRKNNGLHPTCVS